MYASKLKSSTIDQLFEVILKLKDIEPVIVFLKMYVQSKNCMIQLLKRLRFLKIKI